MRLLIRSQEVDLFDRMVAASSEVNKDIQQNAILLCTGCKIGEGTNQDVGQQSAHFCLEDIQLLIDSVKLEMENEDWDWLSGKAKPVMYKHNPTPLRRNMVKHTMNEILQRDVESAEYNCEKDWGVLPREPYNMSQKSQGQQIAEQLFEAMVSGPKREELNKLASEDDRKKEAEKCKCAMRDYRTKYYERMAKRIPELR